MPLVKGKSKVAVKKNIKTEIAHGKKPKQAVAIALNASKKPIAKLPKPKKMRPE